MLMGFVSGVFCGEHEVVFGYLSLPTEAPPLPHPTSLWDWSEHSQLGCSLL